MKAVSRLGLAMVAAGLAVAPLPAFAQAAPAATNTPATDGVGPRELQNFSLNGTVTKPADSPPATVTRRPRTAAPGPSVGSTATATPRETSATSRQGAPARVAA